MKIKKTQTQNVNRKYIENEIVNFWDNKKYLADVEADIGVSAGILDETGIRGSETSDPTGRQVVTRLIASKALRRIQDNVNAVQYAVDVYNGNPDPKRYLLIKELYWFEAGRKKSTAEIVTYLCIGENTLNRWKRDFIALVASKLGMEV